eukprot:m.21099 g.21099  ORF g.21099 m.21099 type:complete len:513 (+) comp12628_c0_seq2:167-1705(+)
MATLKEKLLSEQDTPYVALEQDESLPEESTTDMPPQAAEEEALTRTYLEEDGGITSARATYREEEKTRLCWVEMEDATYRRIVFPATFCCVATIGMALQLSSYAQALAEEHPSWSSTTINTSLSLEVAFSSFGSFVLADYLKTWGPRKMSILGTVGVLVSLLLAAGSSAVGVESLFVIFLGAGLGSGVGTLFLPAVQHILRWNPQNRGLAAGWVGFSVGCWSLIFTELNASILSDMSVAATLLVNAAILVCIAVPFELIMRFPTVKGPTRKPNMTRRDMGKTQAFWFFFLGYYFILFPGWALAAELHKVVAVICRNPASAKSDNAHLATIVFAAYTFGRLFWSSVSQVIGRKNAFLFYSAVCFVLYLILPSAIRQSCAGGMTVLCICFSLYGASVATQAAMAGEVFGLNNAAVGIALTKLAFGFSGLTSPFIIPAVAETRQSVTIVPGTFNTTVTVVHEDAYDHWFYVSAAVCGAALVCWALVFPGEKGMRKIPCYSNSKPSSEDGHELMKQ